MFNASTKPFSSTVKTLVLVDANVTFLNVALLGPITQFNWSCENFNNSFTGLVISNDSTAIASLHLAVNTKSPSVVGVIFSTLFPSASYQPRNVRPSSIVYCNKSNSSPNLYSVASS